jgi:hypothetical protein
MRRIGLHLALHITTFREASFHLFQEPTAISKMNKDCKCKRRKRIIVTHPRGIWSEYTASLCSRPPVRGEELHPTRASPVDHPNKTRRI